MKREEDLYMGHELNNQEVRTLWKETNKKCPKRRKIKAPHSIQKLYTNLPEI